jgi:hypothetical protein
MPFRWKGPIYFQGFPKVPLHYRDNPGQGHCLFYCIAYALFGTDTDLRMQQTRQIMSECIQCKLSNTEEKIRFYTDQGIPATLCLETFCQQVKNGQVEGTEGMLQVFADYLHVNFLILCTHLPEGCNVALVRAQRAPADKFIMLLNKNNVHWMLLGIPITDQKTYISSVTRSWIQENLGF